MACEFPVAVSQSFCKLLYTYFSFFGGHYVATIKVATFLVFICYNNPLCVRSYCQLLVAKLAMTSRPTTKTTTLKTRGLTYIYTCRSYVHTPRDFTNGASLACRLRQGIFTVMFTSRLPWPERLADTSDSGLLRKQSLQKWKILCLRRRWTAVQNLTPLVLSLAEKFVTVQTNTHTKTNSKRYIHTLPIVDNKAICTRLVQIVLSWVLSCLSCSTKHAATSNNLQITGQIEIPLKSSADKTCAAITFRNAHGITGSETVWNVIGKDK